MRLNAHTHNGACVSAGGGDRARDGNISSGETPRLPHFSNKSAACAWIQEHAAGTRLGLPHHGPHATRPARSNTWLIGSEQSLATSLLHCVVPAIAVTSDVYGDLSPQLLAPWLCLVGMVLGSQSRRCDLLRRLAVGSEH